MYAFVEILRGHLIRENHFLKIQQHNKMHLGRIYHLDAKECRGGRGRGRVRVERWLVGRGKLVDEWICSAIHIYRLGSNCCL